MAMKLILTILNDKDYGSVIDTLEDTDYVYSRIDSTGGFLREGKTTLMIGVPEEQVDDAVHMIQQSCSPAVNPLRTNATLMVLNVDHFEQI
jgi:uncharacterized protein YaaQ